MLRRVVRTALVGALTALVLAVAILPALDAMGRVLIMPPVYWPAARVLLVAFWLVGMAAAWNYQPSGEGGGEVREGRD